MPLFFASRFNHTVANNSDHFYVVRPQGAPEAATGACVPFLSDEPVSQAVSLMLKTLNQSTPIKPGDLKKWIAEFSANHGALRFATEENGKPSGASVFRNWLDWESLSDFVRVKLPAQTAAIQGESKFIFGALSSSLEPSLKSRYEKSPSDDRLWLSLRSGVSEGSFFSPVLQLLASFSQDIFLSGQPDIKIKQVPNATQSVLHGLGLPITFVNSNLGSVSGLKNKDATPASLLSTELAVLREFLKSLSADAQGSLTTKALAAALPAPLLDFVTYARLHSPASKSIDTLFIAFLMSKFGKGSGGSASPQHLKSQVHQVLLDWLSSIDSREQDVTAACPALENSSCFSQVLGALSQFQHEIRYRSDDCRLPMAGLERAYLNSMIRNWMCDILDFKLPAEIAQFDLLLRAKRANNNTHFNDYSSNVGLIDHLDGAANKASGSSSVFRRALREMTERLELSANQDEAVFVLDECGPGFRVGQNRLIA